MLKHLKLITVILSLFVTSLLSAQVPSQKVSDNPSVAAANLRPYFYDGEQGGSYDLKGYKPFYISHFGRHGSRYLSNPKYLQPALDVFVAAEAEGLLTQQGEALLDAMRAITDAHEGMYGELAPLGAREHRGVASRMYKREKKVFSQKDRNRVRCVSSVYTRCIVSMANFTEQLSSHAPDLDITYLVGKRLNDESLNVHSKVNIKPEAENIIDSLKGEHLHPEAYLSLYFNDVNKVKSLVSDLYEFEMGIFFYWAVSQDLDFLGLDMLSLVPVELIAECGQIESAHVFAIAGVSEEFGAHVSVAGKSILKDIVLKADEALRSDSDLVADLRFAHDSGLLPTCQLLGVEGFPTYTVREAHQNWRMAEVVPMCANLQMVFYENKAGDVLVRIMLNEKPAVIPGLPSVNGIFYHWSDIRNSIMTL